MVMADMIELFGEPISVYTRDQALEDGVLVDVTEHADSRGMIAGYPDGLPVALTASVWADVQAIPNTSNGRMQDVPGRLHDILWMGRGALRRAMQEARQNGVGSALFEVYLSRQGDRQKRRIYKLVASGDEAGNPCITIMQRLED